MGFLIQKSKQTKVMNPLRPEWTRHSKRVSLLSTKIGEMVNNSRPGAEQTELPVCVD
jgi:hypothetical protein